LSVTHSEQRKEVQMKTIDATYLSKLLGSLARIGSD